MPAGYERNRMEFDAANNVHLRENERGREAAREDHREMAEARRAQKRPERVPPPLHRPADNIVRNREAIEGEYLLISPTQVLTG